MPERGGMHCSGIELHGQDNTPPLLFCLPTLTAKCSVNCHMLPLNGQLSHAIPDTSYTKSSGCLAHNIAHQ